MTESFPLTFRAPKPRTGFALLPMLLLVLMLYGIILPISVAVVLPHDADPIAVPVTFLVFSLLFLFALIPFYRWMITRSKVKVIIDEEGISRIGLIKWKILWHQISRWYCFLNKYGESICIEAKGGKVYWMPEVVMVDKKNVFDIYFILKKRCGTQSPYAERLIPGRLFPPADFRLDTILDGALAKLPQKPIEKDKLE